MDTDHDNPAIELDAVSHWFGSSPALRDLRPIAPRARVTVLLGPNGAGKTTAIRAITGALRAREGTIRTLGADPRDPSSGQDIRGRCGVVSASPALYDRLSGRDNLRYAAQLFGIEEPLLSDRVAEAAARFGIDRVLDDQVGGYSTGMKTRLALARSIVHDPELLLYDEPTSGLDPESSQAVLRLIGDLTDDAKTVVMCTHLLAEAEGLADHIVMMEAGTALCSGSPETLSETYLPGAVVLLDAESPDQLDRIATWHGVRSYQRTDIATVKLDGIGRIPDLVMALTRDGVRLTRVDPHEPTLEALYFAVRAELGNSDALPPLAARRKVAPADFDEAMPHVAGTPTVPSTTGVARGRRR